MGNLALYVRLTSLLAGASHLSCRAGQRAMLMTGQLMKSGPRTQLKVRFFEPIQPAGGRSPVQP